jgi:DNA-binding transcriptional LysR family regulator
MSQNVTAAADNGLRPLPGAARPRPHTDARTRSDAWATAARASARTTGCGREPSRVLPRDEIPAAVATGSADLGLLDGLAAPSDPLRLPDVAPLTTHGVGEEPVAVLLPAGHPLAGRPGLRLADLADARWLDAPDAALPLAQLRAATGGGVFRPALRYDGSDVRTLAALTATGHGLTLLPRRTATGIPGTVAVPVIAPRVVHRVELVYGGTPAGAAADLVTGLLDGARGAGGA